MGGHIVHLHWWIGLLILAALVIGAAIILAIDGGDFLGEHFPEVDQYERMTKALGEPKRSTRQGGKL